MKFFEKIKNMETEFSEFSKQIDKISIDLQKYNELELINIRKIKNSFDEVTKDFLDKDRKLNIGIIGQIKTGRSSFLNTLLFDGKNVLPKAVTPKTVTVTKIRFSKENYIEVEYYTKREWDFILKKSTQNSEDEISKEIIKSANKNNLSVLEFADRENEIIKRETFDELKEILNDYIGENGKYTPVVKSVNIFINKKILKHICIIDTPGINDPVVSRSDRTKAFLEKCDVVFLLSRSSQFLDKNDVSLLTNTIPEKGVKKLVLVCSRYDDGLNDTLMGYENFETANTETKKNLFKHSNKVFSSIINSAREKGESEEVISMYRETFKPVFISSKAHVMSRKFVEDYDDDEMNIYKNLNYFKTLNNKTLEKIGNFNEIEKLFVKVSNEKEESLLKRCNSFIPDAKKKIKSELERARFTLAKRINLLSTTSKNDLKLQRDSMLNQMGKISDSLDIVFNELNYYLDYEAEKTLMLLEDEQKKSLELEEIARKETVAIKELLSVSKWYNPFSWGKKEIHKESFEEEYSFLNVEDAISRIQEYANNYEKETDNSIHLAIKTGELRNKLLISVMENNDRFSENYDPLYFNALTRRSLDSISIPEMSIDITSFLEIISEKYSGELKNASDKSGLKALLTSCVRSLYSESKEVFFVEIENFKEKLNILKNDFYKSLYENITSEYELLLENHENSQRKIKEYENLIFEINSRIDEFSIA